MGHYLVGRLFGVKAETFSIGFGREVAGWTDRRGTRWKVGWLPLGGYVKFKGEMVPGGDTVAPLSTLPPSERVERFDAKPAWQRFLIVLAGPLTNFIVAILIFIALFSMTGLPTTPAVVGQTVPGGAAEKAGLQANDRILAIGGGRIETFAELADTVRLRPDQPLRLTVERGGRTFDLSVTPSRSVERGQSLGTLGVVSRPMVWEKGGPAAVVKAAFRQTGDVVETMIVYLRQIVTGARPASEMGGPLKIAELSGEQVSAGWLNFAVFAALISINLGFMNLLPVPILDGGYLVLYAIEALRRRPVPAAVQETALRIGLAALVMLTVFVTANDLASFGLFRNLRGLIG
ncbi:RIP metalloprotease RseP [Allosphingosinicella flava]|uniref:Zinc metalloprotease n=2 Tax=Allosphingosinicella flava TaxID=2771430 RepID=A0A7T2GLS7_9SPHN|nr:RIP metalloprotease RseP [Sphingosinicella flava]